MSNQPTIEEELAVKGVSRRDFLKLCGMYGCCALHCPKAAQRRSRVRWQPLRACR